MHFLKQHRSALLIGGAILLIGGGWLLFWHIIGTRLEQAGDEAAFDSFTYSDAYYIRCDEDVLADYIGEAAGDALCGSSLGTLDIATSAGTAAYPIYRCKPLEEAGKRDAILLLEYGGDYLTYELNGFSALDALSPIGTVCAAYGLESAEDLDSVAVYDADGTLLDTVTEPADLAGFYAKLTALGDALTDEETAARYYASYAAEYGETDAITVTDGKVEAADDETYSQAMTLWSTGLCLVDIRLKNGLQLRQTVYMPAAGMYTVYGTYALETAFFS